MLFSHFPYLETCSQLVCSSVRIKRNKPYKDTYLKESGLFSYNFFDQLDPIIGVIDPHLFQSRRPQERRVSTLLPPPPRTSVMKPKLGEVAGHMRWDRISVNLSRSLSLNPRPWTSATNQLTAMDEDNYTGRTRSICSDPPFQVNSMPCHMAAPDWSYPLKSGPWRPTGRLRPGVAATRNCVPGVG